MSLLLVIVNALVPIAFVILLGWMAGRLGLLESESSSTLAVLALDFCLPSLLFVATAGMSLGELRDWRFFLSIALGLLAIYVVALIISRVFFRQPLAASSLQALNSAFPNMAFMGIPVLTAAIGASAVLSVVVGNLISSFVLLPVTLTLLEAGNPTQGGRTGMAVVWSSILGAVEKPLVWAPLAGIVLAVAHIHLPAAAQKSFSLIGDATSGVALFAMGLMLNGQKLRIGAAVALNTVLKNLAQPAVMWLLALLLGVTGANRREMILLGALPTASMTAMFAVQYKVYTEESDATIVLSTALSIGTLGLVIALAG
jgi:malonate transporter and related proteins